MGKETNKSKQTTTYTHEKRAKKEKWYKSRKEAKCACH
jgi:hypothetical protein